MELINLVQTYRQCARELKQLHERTHQELSVSKEQLALAHNDLSTARRELENERHTNQVTVHELKCQLSSVQAELDSTHEAINVLQKADESVIEARTRVNDEKRKSQDLRKQFSQAEAEWDACRSVLMDRVKFLEEQSELMARDLQEASDSLHSSRSTVSSLEIDKRRLESEMRSLEIYLKEKESQINIFCQGARNEQNESIEQIVTLTEQLHAERMGAVLLKADLERVNHQLASVESMMVGLRESEAHLKHALTNKVSEKGEIASLQNELTSTRSELAQCRAELANQSHNLCKLRQQKMKLKKQRSELVKLIRRLSDSEEEATRYSLKELTKSARVALDAIFHFERKIKTKAVGKNQIDLVISAMSIHGKDNPEVLFFGAVLVRDWFLSEVQSMDKYRVDNIDPLINSICQGCINVINNFKSRSDGDSLVVHAYWTLLVTLLSRRICMHEPFNAISPITIHALGDLVSAELLMALSPDACGSALACLPLLVESTSDACFVKRDIAQFCFDFIASTEPVESDSLSSYALEYLTLCGSKSEDAIRIWFVEKLLSKTQLLRKVSSSLAIYVNARHSLFISLRFVAQLLAIGLSTLNVSDTGSAAGLFAFVGGGSSPGAGNRDRVPGIFNTVNLEDLDDVFSAYSDENMQEGDSEILIAVCAIGRLLCEFYGTNSSARGTAVSTHVKKWALSAIVSHDALVAATGFSLIGYIHRFGPESVSYLIHPDTMVDCMQTMTGWSFEWARNETFAFIENLVKRENVDTKETGKYMQIFIEKFKFHPGIMSSDEMKLFFFKSVSVKEAYVRLLDSLMNESVTHHQLVVVSRVLLQMILAVRSRGSLADFQAEIVRLESERLTRRKINPGGSPVVTLFRNISMCRNANDDVTAEILLHVLAGLVGNRSQKFNATVLNLFSESDHMRLSSVIDPDGEDVSHPDLAIPGHAGQTFHQDVISAFIAKLDPQTKEIEESDHDGAESRDPQPKDDIAVKEAESGWMDSAANWLLDTVAGDEEDDTAPNNIQEKPKMKKKRDDEPPVLRPSISKQLSLKEPEPSDHASVRPVAEKAPPPNVPLTPKAPVKVPVKTPMVKAPTKTVPTKMAVKKPAVKTPTVIPKSAPITKPVVKKAVAAPPKPAPKVEPVHEEAEEEALPKAVEKPKKAKKTTETAPASYFGDPSELYNTFGGWFGSAEPPKKEKKKKNDEE